MPSFSLDDTTARQLLDLAARRNRRPEEVLVELITQAAGPPLPVTLTEEAQARQQYQKDLKFVWHGAWESGADIPDDEEQP